MNRFVLHSQCFECRWFAFERAVLLRCYFSSYNSAPSKASIDVISKKVTSYCLGPWIIPCFPFAHPLERGLVTTSHGIIIFDHHQSPKAICTLPRLWHDGIRHCSLVLATPPVVPRKINVERSHWCQSMKRNDRDSFRVRRSTTESRQERV